MHPAGTLDAVARDPLAAGLGADPAEAAASFTRQPASTRSTITARPRGPSLAFACSLIRTSSEELGRVATPSLQGGPDNNPLRNDT